MLVQDDTVFVTDDELCGVLNDLGDPFTFDGMDPEKHTACSVVSAEISYYLASALLYENRKIVVQRSPNVRNPEPK